MILTNIFYTIEDPLARSVRQRLKKLGILNEVPVAYSTEKPHHVKLLPLGKTSPPPPPKAPEMHRKLIVFIQQRKKKSKIEMNFLHYQTLDHVFCLYLVQSQVCLVWLLQHLSF